MEIIVLILNKKVYAQAEMKILLYEKQTYTVTLSCFVSDNAAQVWHISQYTVSC